MGRQTSLSLSRRSNDRAFGEVGRSGGFTPSAHKMLLTPREICSFKPMTGLSLGRLIQKLISRIE
jgi:hypothetical protein